MKNYLSKIFAVLILIATVNSCTTRDTVVDEVLDGVENGAVLRTIQIIDAEYAIGSVDPNWSIEIEEQDVEDGALLDNVQVYVSWTDTSEGTQSSEVLYQTITASEFSTDTPFGLPRTMISLSLADALATTGVSEDDIFGGDFFPLRLVLNLTDGRSFTNTDAAGIITGGFFASPYLYNIPVVCAIPEDYMIGDYFMERTSTVEDPFFPNYGQAISDQLVTVDGTGATRSFGHVYYPTSFALGYVMELTLSCGDIFVFGTWPGGTLGCGAGGIEQSSPVVPSTYSLADDTVFDIDLLDFEGDGGCGTGNYEVSIRLTKQ